MTVANIVSYVILPVTPFAEKGKRSYQLYSAYTNRCKPLGKTKILLREGNENNIYKRKS